MIIDKEIIVGKEVRRTKLLLLSGTFHYYLQNRTTTTNLRKTWYSGEDRTTRSQGAVFCPPCYLIFGWCLQADFFNKRYVNTVVLHTNSICWQLRYFVVWGVSDSTFYIYVLILQYFQNPKTEAYVQTFARYDVGRSIVYFCRRNVLRLPLLSGLCRSNQIVFFFRLYVWSGIQNRRLLSSCSIFVWWSGHVFLVFLPKITGYVKIAINSRGIF